MADDPRRRTSEYGIHPRTPSGRTTMAELESEGDGFTPPPVDVESYHRRQGSRLSVAERELAILGASLSQLGKDVAALESRHDTMGESLVQLRLVTGEQNGKLDMIKIGVDRIEAARSKGGDRAWQIVALLIAATSAVVALVALATR